MAVDSDETGIPEPTKGGGFAQLRRESINFWMMCRVVDQKYRLAANSKIATVSEDVDEPCGVSLIVGLATALSDQRVLVAAKPVPRPRFVGPGKAQWKTGCLLLRTSLTGRSKRRRPLNQ